MQPMFELGSPEHINYVCGRKRRFPTIERAKTNAKMIRKNTGRRLRPYSCRFCTGWHLGHHRKPGNLNKYLTRIKSAPGGDAQSIFPAQPERSMG